MLALSLRGIATRKLRTALTAFAVVLGVALVSGTYLLTDTINSAFDEVFQTANRGVDVVVTPARLFGSGSDQASVAPNPLRASVLAQVRRVPGVAFAAGSVQGLGQIYGKNDKPIITTGAPMFIFDRSPKRFDPFVWVAGRPPSGPGEVTLDKFSADKAGYRVGDAVKLSGQGPQQRFRLVGIAKFGEASSLGGAAIAIVSRSGCSTCTTSSPRSPSRRTPAPPRPNSPPRSAPCCRRERRRSAPASSRPRPTRRTSRTTCRSCARSCSCSPASRCSWAPS
jgi:putative ABC transport system permease protein